MEQKQTDGLRITFLKAENIKCLKAVEIKPEQDTSVIIIGGANGAGKSSTLDSIAYAMGGQALIPDNPIRDGQKAASVVVDLGELVVRRNFKRQDDGRITSQVVVTNAEGFKAEKPQSLLNKMADKLTFDPMQFASLGPAEQVAILKNLVGLDFDKLDAQREKLYDDRTLTNREITNLEERTKSVPDEVKQAPAELVDMVALTAELTGAHDVNRANRGQRALLSEAEAALELVTKDSAEDVRVAKQVLAIAEQAMASDIKAAKLLCERHQGEVFGLKDIDVEPIVKSIAGAQEVNRLVGQRKVVDDLQADLAQAVNVRDAFTDDIRSIDAEKKALLEKTEFPIAGLGFSAGGVSFEDHAFETISTSERILCSAAIGLAMHPNLRVLFIREGEKLDAGNRVKLAEWARDNNCQLWVEDCRAGEAGEATVVIEAGSILKEVNDE